MIERYLSIIEVSQKQAYIFGSNKLAENIERSAEIWWLTDPACIQELVNNKNVFDKERNTVYAGGGHTVLMFDTLDTARDFHKRYSFLLRTMNPTIDVFLFTLPYCSKVAAEKMLDYVCAAGHRTQDDDETFAIQEAMKGLEDVKVRTPDRYLKALVTGLERKKSLRLASFRQGSFGVEFLDSNTRDIDTDWEDKNTSSEANVEMDRPFMQRSNYDGSPCETMIQEEETLQYERLKKAHKNLKGSYPVSNAKYTPAYHFENLGGSKGDVNFLAVIHIDGNGMGARCNAFYESLQKKYILDIEAAIEEAKKTWGTERTSGNCAESEEAIEKAAEKEAWRLFQNSVREFSEGIDFAFKSALKRMFQKVENSLECGKLKDLSLKRDERQKPYFPIRGIIASGDDICFVTDGRIGIECASIFLEELASQVSSSDGKAFSASAGVAIVHQKYPFFRAYELAEQLCSNAKTFASNVRLEQENTYRKEKSEQEGISSIEEKNINDILDPLHDNGSGICAIDWHLEMGEIGMSVEEIRRNYLSRDVVNGKRRHLEMRPYIVKVVSDTDAPFDTDSIEPHRQYKVFRSQMGKYLDIGKEEEDVHSKLKELRGILKKGLAETEHYIQFHKLRGMVVNNYYGSFENVQIRQNPDTLPIYVKTADGEERSVLFDVAEALEIYSLM